VRLHAGIPPQEKHQLLVYWEAPTCVCIRWRSNHRIKFTKAVVVSLSLGPEEEPVPHREAPEVESRLVLGRPRR